MPPFRVPGKMDMSEVTDEEEFVNVEGDDHDSPPTSPALMRGRNAEEVEPQPTPSTSTGIRCPWGSSGGGGGSLGTGGGGTSSAATGATVTTNKLPVTMKNRASPKSSPGVVRTINGVKIVAGRFPEDDPVGLNVDSHVLFPPLRSRRKPGEPPKSKPIIPSLAACIVQQPIVKDEPDEAAGEEATPEPEPFQEYTIAEPGSGPSASSQSHPDPPQVEVHDEDVDMEATSELLQETIFADQEGEAESSAPPGSPQNVEVHDDAEAAIEHELQVEAHDENVDMEATSERLQETTFVEEEEETESGPPGSPENQSPQHVQVRDDAIDAEATIEHELLDYSTSDEQESDPGSPASTLSPPRNHPAGVQDDVDSAPQSQMNSLELSSELESAQRELNRERCQNSNLMDLLRMASDSLQSAQQQLNDVLVVIQGTTGGRGAGVNMPTSMATVERGDPQADPGGAGGQRREYSEVGNFYHGRVIGVTPTALATLEKLTEIENRMKEDRARAQSELASSHLETIENLYEIRDAIFRIPAPKAPPKAAKKTYAAAVKGSDSEPVLSTPVVVRPPKNPPESGGTYAQIVKATQTGTAVGTPARAASPLDEVVDVSNLNYAALLNQNVPSPNENDGDNVSVAGSDYETLSQKFHGIGNRNQVAQAPILTQPQHERDERKSRGAQQFCTCGLEFTNAVSLWTHCNMSGPPRLKCDQDGCGATFYVLSQLNMHLKDVHGMMGPHDQCMCYKCFASFKDKKLKARHRCPTNSEGGKAGGPSPAKKKKPNCEQ